MISLTSQIMCVERELKMRHTMYPRWAVKAPNNWPQSRIDNEIETMAAVLATLKELRRVKEEPELPLQQPVKAPVPGMSNRWVEPEPDRREEMRGKM